MDNITLKVLLYEKRNGIKNGFYHLNQIVFAYNSNHIEGSRLTKEQTRFIYETNSIVSEKDGEKIKINDIIETKNHFRAFDFILENYDKKLDENLLKNIHKILKTDTTDIIVGDFKKFQNYVGDIKTTSPKNVEKEISKILKEYNSKDTQTIEDIIKFHHDFESIHPFQDGNGRTGRLIMFKECLKNNITPFIIDDDHKAFYYRGLKNFNTSKGYLIDTCLSCQDEYKSVLNDYLKNTTFNFDEAFSNLEKVMSDFSENQHIIDSEMQKMLNIPSVDEVVVDNKIKNEKDRNKNRR